MIRVMETEQKCEDIDIPCPFLFFDTRLGDQTGKIVGKFLHKRIASGHLFKVTDSKS